jgi:NADH:ubiquinone oxidoreductase subunit F (NADH-binding)
VRESFASSEVAPPSGAVRLLWPDSARRGNSLADHLDRWGPVSFPGPGSQKDVVAALEESGLRGRGGAWFPAYRKWRAVSQARRRPVVVVNASEGEPASLKDAVLLTRELHLVADGAMWAASTLGATKVVFFVPRRLAVSVTAALQERARAGMASVDAEVVEAPDGYLTGEESAAVNFLSGGPTRSPTFTRLTPTYRRGVGGAPTLLHNAETLAHAALIARFGPAWYRSVGTRDSPGTTLLTVGGLSESPKVVEVATGTDLKTVLQKVGADPSSIQGVLFGGYGGGWVAAPKAFDLCLDPESLARAGAALGPGVVFLLQSSACPVAQVAGLSQWMSAQSAGQCGPCRNGLAALADELGTLAAGRAKKDSLERVGHYCSLVAGRGACHHPDGVARMVTSALEAFSEDFRLHARSRRCGAPTKLLLPTTYPSPQPVRRNRPGGI